VVDKRYSSPIKVLFRMANRKLHCFTWIFSW